MENKWIKVKDRLPELGTTVLVCLKTGYRTAAHRCIVKRINSWQLYGDMDTVFDLKYEEITHWMPLPEPPIQP